MSYKIKDISSELHDWNGDEYNKNSHIQYLWAIELLKYYDFRGDETVLDIGCGDGKITAEIARYLPLGQIYGIDKSDSMITFASRNFLKKKFNNLHFFKQDASEIYFQNKFDLVFSAACLQWIKEQLVVLGNIYLSLKSEGIFLALIPSPVTLDQAIEKVIIYERWEKYFKKYKSPCYEYSVEEYRNYLISSGFLILRLEKKVKNMKFETRSQLLKWLLAVLKFESLPTPEWGHFTEDVIDVLLNQHPQAALPNGELQLPIPVMEIKARKPKLPIH